MPLYYKASTGQLLACPGGKIANNCYCDVLAPVICLGGTLSFETFVGATLNLFQNMTVTNCGSDPSTLTWGRTLTEDAGIIGTLSTDETSGVLDYNEVDTIQVTFNPTGVAQGTYAGSINISETVLSGVDPESLAVSVVIRPKYTGKVAMRITAGTGPLGWHEMGYNSGGGGATFDKWSLVWNFPFGIIYIRRYFTGQWTAYMTNGAGSPGAEVDITSLVSLNAAGYPEDGPVTVTVGGFSQTFIFGPDVT